MPSPVPFTAVVLAADRTAADPVARAAGVECKALSPIGGTPMVLRVLAALEASRAVADCVLCGPPRGALGREPRLERGIAAGRWRWLEHQASPSRSAAAALQTLAADRPVLLTTADHALLTPEMVDYFCDRARAGGWDVVVALASYSQVVAAYPQARRTVLRFRDGAYCGCNLFGLLTPRAHRVVDFWRRVEEQRKRPWRVIGALGWWAVLRYLTGRLTLTEALEGISRRLDLRAGAVILPFAEAAIDVDSVADWRLAQQLAAEPDRQR